MCDPKREEEGEGRSNRYDLYADEIRQMNFRGVPVVFDHNKKRRPLGRVVYAWHDHNFPNTDMFAVAFLAEITNKSLLHTPACVTMMGDSFVSLSTYEHDRTDVVEVSVTFCGARDGCVGMFVPHSRLGRVMNKFGLAPCHYKWQQKKVCAKYTMSDEKNTDLESILRQLPESQYKVIMGHLNQEQKSQKELIDKVEGYNEAVGLLSDYLGSMIHSRIALEQKSNTPMAEKRKRDLQMMREKGVFDRGCSDLEAIREMVQYCKECFPDGSGVEKEVVEKFCNMFDDRFPHLKDKLHDRGMSLATVDAAFHLINEDIRDKDVARLHRDKARMEERKKAITVAKKHFNLLDTTKETVDSGSRDMGFEQFLKSMGVSHEEEDDTVSSPPKKRARHLRHKEKKRLDISDDGDDDDDENFMAYAIQQEKNYQKMRKRYKSYKRDYVEHKQKRQEYQNRQLEELMDCVPTLSKMAKYFEGKIGRDDKRDDGQAEPMDAVGSPSSSTTSPTSCQKKTIDASMKANEKTHNNDPVKLFDL